MKIKLENFWKKTRVPLNDNSGRCIALASGRDVDGAIYISLIIVEADKKTMRQVAQVSLKGASKLAVLLVSVLRDLVLMDEDGSQGVAQKRFRGKD